MSEKRIRLLKAGADAFPALEIAAAAPAVLVDDDHVTVPQDFLTPTLMEVWAAELSATIETHVFAARALDADASPWTHWLRVRGDEGEAPTADFVVQARGLPADQLEAAAHGYEYGELEVGEAWELPGEDPQQ